MPKEVYSTLLELMQPLEGQVGKERVVQIVRQARDELSCQVRPFCIELMLLLRTLLRSYQNEFSRELAECLVQ
jgi:hypothetical protein